MRMPQSEPVGDLRRTTCLLCPGQLGRPWHEVHGHRLLACPSCGMGWTEAVPSADELVAIYGPSYFRGDTDGYPDYLAAEPALRDAARRHLAVLDERHPARGRLLDVGCAAGVLLDEARRHGWSVVGVELSADMCAIAAQRGLDVVHAPYLEARLAPGSFDVVVAAQVLEHAVCPLCWLRRAARHLRPGGTLLIETWDAESFVARLLGARWQQLSPPSVQFWFNRRSLAGLLAEAGFEMLSFARAPKAVTLERGLALVEGKLLPWTQRRLLRAAKALGIGGLLVRYPLDDLVRVVARRR